MPTEEAVALELREGKGSWKIDVQKENLFLTNDKEEWLTDELNGFIESTGSPFRARLNCIIICAALTCVFSAVGASREVYWNRRMQQS